MRTPSAQRAQTIYASGTDFESGPWGLYYVEYDCSESEDLAAQCPARVEEMKKLWWEDEDKNSAVPLLEARRSGNGAYDRALPARRCLRAAP